MKQRMWRGRKQEPGAYGTFYHGLVPQDLVKGWKQIFGASTWIAQYMVDQCRSSSGNNNFNSMNLQHRKPQKEAIYGTADNVMKSYLGQRRLHLMERGGGGGIKFIKSKVAG